MLKINSKKNTQILHAKKLGKNNNYREKCGEFLCDGKKLLVEAIESGSIIESVFTVSPLDLKLNLSTKVYNVSSDLLEYISPLKNPNDIVFICKIPKPPIIDYTKGTHILLDNVQDPGNIGTILRSADAFNIDSIILTGECADPYNPKTIRASMGAIFRQKIKDLNTQQIKQLNTKIIGTGCNSDYTPIKKAELKDSIIVFGNEGNGISDAVSKLCTNFITIPISGNCESLNISAAASIVMWEVSNGR